MVIRFTGSVETVEDVEKLTNIIRRGESGPGDDFFWAGYPILIALEEYWTGLSMDPDKEARVESLVTMVNRILSDGLILLPEERESVVE